MNQSSMFEPCRNWYFYDVYLGSKVVGCASARGRLIPGLFIFFVVLGGPIPPKTLNEAGTMAICHSAAWDAKVRNHMFVNHLVARFELPTI